MLRLEDAATQAQHRAAPGRPVRVPPLLGHRCSPGRGRGGRRVARSLFKGSSPLPPAREPEAVLHYSVTGRAEASERWRQRAGQDRALCSPTAHLWHSGTRRKTRLGGNSLQTNSQANERVQVRSPSGGLGRRCCGAALAHGQCHGRRDGSAGTAQPSSRGSGCTETPLETQHL